MILKLLGAWLAFFFSVILISASVLPVYAGPVAWLGVQNISETPDSLSDSPSVAAVGSNVYVAWCDDSPGNLDIYFRRSADNGATCEPIKNLSNNAGSSSDPSVAAVGGKVYVAWDDDSKGNWEIFFKRSMDGGATWKPIQRLTTNTGASRHPSVAAVGTDVYVAWDDDSKGNWEIFFKRSTDNGASWKSVQRLTTNTGSSLNPSVAAVGSKVYVVWQDSSPGNYEVFFRRSIDYGVTWELKKRLTTNAGASEVPSIAAVGSKVHVAWSNSVLGNKIMIFYRRSSDYGVSWELKKQLSCMDDVKDFEPIPNPPIFSDPSIAAVGNNVYATYWWCEPDPYSVKYYWARVFFKWSADRGATWQPTQYLDDSSTLLLGYPSIAAVTTNIYVAWIIGNPQWLGHYDILFNRGSII